MGINVSNWVNKEIVQLIMLTRGEQRCSAADMIVVETSGSCMIRILSKGVMFTIYGHQTTEKQCDTARYEALIRGEIHYCGQTSEKECHTIIIRCPTSK